MLEGAQVRPAEINARMPRWGDREVGRYLFRHALFQRRGLSDRAAELLADRLALRDFDRDDRRMCIECSSLQQSGGCFAASQGRIPRADKRMHPVKDILARCEAFEWVMPA